MIKLSTMQVKIIDFGFSQQISFKENVMKWARGSSYYMAPEIFMKSKFGFHSDVYSYGISMVEHIHQRQAYNPENIRSFFEEHKRFFGDFAYNVENDQNKLFFYCHHNQRPFLGSEINDSLRNLIQRCWSGNIKVRPSFSQIIKELKTILPQINI